MPVSNRIALLICLAAAPLIMMCGGASQAAPPAAAGQPAAVLPGDSERGRQLFGESCAACHGRDARGVAGLGKDLAAGEFARGLSDAELIAFIIEGRKVDDPLNTTGKPMAPRGGNPRLSDQDLADIVAYLRALEGQP